MARVIPPDVLAAMLPDCNIGVTEMLQNHSFIESIQKSEIKPVFSPDAPAFTLAHMHVLWAPLLSAISAADRLRRPFNDEWLSGAQSVRAARLSLPLWFENLLSLVAHYVRKRNSWLSGLTWLNKVVLHPRTGSPSHIPDLVDTCRYRLDVVPWDSVVPDVMKNSMLTTQDLARFLRDRQENWLNDEMINAGASWITQRVSPETRVHVVNCLSFNVLQRRYKAASGQSYTRMQGFRVVDNSLAADSLDDIYIPLHVNNHWALVHVNLDQHTISYADSLKAKAAVPAEAHETIEWWLRSFNKDFASLRVVQPAFNVPNQRDTSSCGIIVLTTLAAILLHYTAWSVSSGESERMEWFLRLSEVFVLDEDAEVENDTDCDDEVYLTFHLSLSINIIS